jgi:hypothetical protein
MKEEDDNFVRTKRERVGLFFYLLSNVALGFQQTGIKVLYSFEPWISNWQMLYFRAVVALCLNLLWVNF